MASIFACTQRIMARNSISRHTQKRAFLLYACTKSRRWMYILVCMNTSCVRIHIYVCTMYLIRKQCDCIWVYVCISMQGNTAHLHTRTYIHTYIHIYVWMYDVRHQCIRLFIDQTIIVVSRPFPLALVAGYTVRRCTYINSWSEL